MLAPVMLKTIHACLPHFRMAQAMADKAIDGKAAGEPVNVLACTTKRCHFCLGILKKR